MLWSELIHMYIAGYMVTGFLRGRRLRRSCRLRGRWGRYERVAMTIPLTIACLAAPVQVLVGDWIARVIAIQQPIKLAAIEGLYKTTRGASEHVLGWYTNGQIKFGIGDPPPALAAGLPQLGREGHRPGHRAAGRAAADQRHPPLLPDDGGDRDAAGAAGGRSTCSCASATLAAAWRWFYWAVVLAGPAATVALIAGWVTAEVGRQPWVVYQVMTTAQSVTGAGGIPVGYAALVVTYIARGGRRRVDPAAAGAHPARRRPAPTPRPHSTAQPA